ncbi:unnamed protein product [Polarella glacialis]|uniref:Uncharacterized protein n=1 Tax=Polarella glacialis TaxID=89957 RepID=A0A813F1W6_POLGL|nr:unnamed protein product [Polarella glacialis]CAE8738297.1 unnamed protein product [Polarella glacialis]|mmetsp:Transcript_69163/g.111497  ORF Transcript_69163/g.111497 Transcript_69163/m.111497 type:complete len:344 (+) Transcript_69163:97-1128(+)
MEASATFASSSSHGYLTSKFQVGSAKSDKINFSLAQKVFHSGDVPREVLESKRTVQKKKQANILGTEQRDWNTSTIADQKIQKDVHKDLKRQLLKVRAGLMDEKVQKPSKFHTDEAIVERQKFIVAMTGQGPIGKLCGKWFNPVDERGLAAHCIADHWPDWNTSHSAHTKEDIKEAQVVLERKDQRRRRMEQQAQLNPSATYPGYINPHTSITNVNDALRERKIDFQDLKEQFKRELKVEFPQASEERLQAMAQRLLNEKLLADEKMSRFPVQHESFRPNLSLTTQDRRYKEYHHPGTYAWNEAEKRNTWSCCLNFGQDGRGCECKVVNPDAWCYLGFEKGTG